MNFRSRHVVLDMRSFFEFGNIVFGLLDFYRLVGRKSLVLLLHLSEKNLM